MKELFIPDWNDLYSASENYTGIINVDDIVKIYFLNGKKHREDGPAMIWNEPTEYNSEYYLNGYSYQDSESWFQSLTEDEKEKALFNIDEWS